MSNHENQCPVPRGKLMIIGGAEEKQSNAEPEVGQDVLKEFIKLCGDSPRIEIITTAGEEAVNETFEEYAVVLKI